MPVKQVPTTNFRTATWGAWKDGINDFRDAVKEVPGVSATITTEVIVSGAITPDSGDILVDTEGGATADDLVAFSNWASIPENRTIRLRPVSDDRTINIVHLFNNGGGSGEFVLLTGDDPGDRVAMDDRRRSMDVERRGTQIFEVRRNGFSLGGSGGSFDGNLSGPLQGNNNRATGLIWNERNITLSEAPGGNYTAKVSDVGDWLNARIDTVVTLPNPNVLDSAGETWLAGMQIAMQRHASVLRSITHTGATPNHYLNHDRAAGSVSGAVIFFKVCEANDGTLFWRLMGETTGTGGVGVPGTTNRSFISSSPVDYSFTGTDLAYRSIGTLTHTPPASTKWIYFANFTQQATGTNAGNDVRYRVVNTAAATTPLAAVARTRVVQREHYTTAWWGASYGASPSSQTYRLEGALGTSGMVIESKAIFMYGLQLEADEDFGVQATTSVTAGTTYTAIATKSYTAPAGDYLVITAATISNSGDERYSCKLTVGASDYGVTASSRMVPGIGYYTTFKKITHAGGTLTATLNAKQDSSGTLTATNGVVIILSAARFQMFDYAESIAETALMASNVQTTKLSKNSTLQANWKHLVLMGMQGYVDNDGSDSGVVMGGQMNGTEFSYEAEHSIHLITSEPAHYASTSYMTGRVVTPVASPDVFTLRYASQDAVASVKVKDAVIAIMALVPVT